jgi:arsenate reductase
MAEKGIDISSFRSKHVKDVMDIPFDVVITVCDHAKESCPLFPKPVKKVHKNFNDPPTLAKMATSEEEVLNIYRRIRDEIRAYVETLPESLSSNTERT